MDWSQSCLLTAYRERRNDGLKEHRNLSSNYDVTSIEKGQPFI